MVAALYLPPKAAAALALKRGQTKAGGVDMEAYGLGCAESETIQDPDRFGVIVKAKGTLTENVSIILLLGSNIDDDGKVGGPGKRVTTNQVSHQSLQIHDRRVV